MTFYATLQYYITEIKKVDNDLVFILFYYILAVNMQRVSVLRHPTNIYSYQLDTILNMNAFLHVDACYIEFVVVLGR